MATDPDAGWSPNGAAFKLIARRGSPVGAQIDPTVVDDLRAFVRRAPETDVQQLLGICPDTWNRIKRGSTVRPSTAKRLISRIMASQTEIERT